MSSCSLRKYRAFKVSMLMFSARANIPRLQPICPAVSCEVNNNPFSNYLSRCSLRSQKYPAFDLSIPLSILRVKISRFRSICFAFSCEVKNILLSTHLSRCPLRRQIYSAYLLKQTKQTIIKIPNFFVPDDSDLINPFLHPIARPKSHFRTLEKCLNKT